jgi:transposase
MLQESNTMQAADDAVLAAHALIEQLQAELKFKRTRIEALNFEIARLKHWRFGSSSESLDGSTQAVLFDFCTSRAGEPARQVLDGFKGTLVSDDYAGYHALPRNGVTAAFCVAHVRRKLFEVHRLNGSEIAGQAVTLIGRLDDVERDARGLDAEGRRHLRQVKAEPLAKMLHSWLTEQRLKLATADTTAKAIDYALSNWRALTHYLDDGDVPIDNNAAENAIRPLCLGLKNWLFVGSAQAGERAAVLMSLIESAKLNDHDPWVHLKDVLERLPTLKNRDLAQLLPHNWRAPTPAPALQAIAT